MDAWMDRLDVMGGWMNEWMGSWIDGWMDDWMDVWMDGWLNWWMDEWMDGLLHACMDECMHELMNGWMDDWMDWIDELMPFLPSWTNGQRHTRLSVLPPFLSLLNGYRWRSLCFRFQYQLMLPIPMYCMQVLRRRWCVGEALQHGFTVCGAHVAGTDRNRRYTLEWDGSYSR